VTPGSSAQKPASKNKTRANLRIAIPALIRSSTGSILRLRVNSRSRADLGLGRDARLLALPNSPRRFPPRAAPDTCKHANRTSEFRKPAASLILIFPAATATATRTPINAERAVAPALPPPLCCYFLLFLAVT
jgi:hypothetical protein